MNIGEIGGWTGALIGGLGGLAGGVIGTYFSIKKTNGPNERRFMIKTAIAGWILLTAFLALLFSLPPQTRWMLWIPYAIALPLGIKYCNKRQSQIRNEDSQNKAVVGTLPRGRVNAPHR